MKELIYKVEDRAGIHARPAALIGQKAVNFKSQITIECNGKTADASNVIQILALGAKYQDELKITFDGEDEEKAYEVIEHQLHHNYAGGVQEALKIAFFGTKDYDRTFFSELTKEKGLGTYNSEIHYFETRLTKETVGLAKGYDAVCIFVNDECGTEVVDGLHDAGIHLILLRCAGFNNVDLKRCKEYGIKVLRVPAYSPYAVAEHAMAILQQANRRLHKAHNKVKDNNFALSGLMGLDLHNKVAGIVSTGKIGQCMAAICKGYGMTVLGWDAFPNPKLEEEGLLTYVSKEELFKRADLISLHAPLIMGEGGTYHLVNKDTIALMKDTAMIVNTARGPLIDPEALIDALKEGKFHAVALDVYEGEDSNVYTDHSDDMLTNDITARLLMFPNVVMTSHQAFFTREALQAIAVVTMENARHFNEGQPFGDAEVEYKG